TGSPEGPRGCVLFASHVHRCLLAGRAARRGRRRSGGMRAVSDAAVPAGTVTFLFTDLEGSTRGSQRTAVRGRADVCPRRVSGAALHRYTALTVALVELPAAGRRHRRDRPIRGVCGNVGRVTDAVFAAIDLGGDTT